MHYGNKLISGGTIVPEVAFGRWRSTEPQSGRPFNHPASEPKENWIRPFSTVRPFVLPGRNYRGISPAIPGISDEHEDVGGNGERSAYNAQDRDVRRGLN